MVERYSCCAHRRVRRPRHALVDGPQRHSEPSMRAVIYTPHRRCVGAASRAATAGGARRGGGARPRGHLGRQSHRLEDAWWCLRPLARRADGSQPRRRRDHRRRGVRGRRHSAGDRVWVTLAADGRPASGTAQEYTVVPAERVFPLPDGADFEFGASIGIPAPPPPCPDRRRGRPGPPAAGCAAGPRRPGRWRGRGGRQRGHPAGALGWRDGHRHRQRRGESGDCRSGRRPPRRQLP